MSQACATIDEFVDLVPEYLTLGDASTGTLTITVQPTPGDTITLTDPYAFPPIVETLAAGTDYAIGATTADTATNLLAALLALPSLLISTTSASAGSLVYLVSAKEGAAGAVQLAASNPAALTFDALTLTGGDALVVFSLSCSCSMINLACWGVKASCASVYLAAHMLTVAGGGEGGAINRKKIDKIEVSFAATGTATGIDADFGSTRWGRLYLAMKKTIFVAPIAGRRGAFIPGCGC